MKRFLFAIILILAISFEALAETGAWNLDTSEITNGNSLLVGQVVNQNGSPVALQLLPNGGLGGSVYQLGITELIGSDGKRYNISPDGIVSSQPEDKEQNPTLPQLPQLPNIGGGGGSSGGGGGGGSSGGDCASGNCGGGGSSGGGGDASGNTTNASDSVSLPDEQYAGVENDNHQPQGSENPLNKEYACSRSAEFLGSPGCGGGGGGGAVKKVVKGKIVAAAGAPGGGGGGKKVPSSLIDELRNRTDNSDSNYSPNLYNIEPIKEMYPNMFGANQDGERPSLAKAYYQNPKELTPPTDLQNIGNDDEVLKTSMAIYQPISRLHNDFNMDEVARDQYIDAAGSARGVAILTMGFLDKTVGTGLKDIQQQADMNTVQHLLKQISWTTDKLANPDRAQIFRDTDEKIEACMELSINKDKAKKEVKDTTRKIVDFKCSDSCGEAPKGSKKYRDDQGPVSKGSGDGPPEGNGSYAYCVCCAESDQKLNKLNEDASGGARTWTLADRLFLGTKKPQGDGKDKIEKMIKIFREMYGDVQIVENKGSGGSKVENLSYVYVFPKYSVQRRIDAIRDGCNYCKGPDCDINEKGKNCPLEELDMKYGICPALGYVLGNWEEINKAKPQERTQEQIDAWQEMQMGTTLTGDDVTAINMLNGDGVLNDKNPTGKKKRFINSFCNSSAFAAFIRYHNRLSAVVNDHATLNRQITDQDRSMVKILMGRVGEGISIGHSDYSANYLVEQMVSGVSIAKDRRLEAEMASAVASAQQGVNNSVAKSGDTKFGDHAELFNDSGGGGKAVTRGADPISQAVGAF